MCDFADSYKYHRLSRGLVVLALSLVFFGSLWLRRKVSGTIKLMALVTIPVESLLERSRPSSEAQARAWCAQLEAGDILLLSRRRPFEFAPDDLAFLLGQQQTDSSLHKNIAYKPNMDTLSGVDTKTADAAAVKRLQAIMRQYSQECDAFLTGFLSPYQATLAAGLCQLPAAGGGGPRLAAAQAQRPAAHRRLPDPAYAWRAHSALL